MQRTVLDVSPALPFRKGGGLIRVGGPGGFVGFVSFFEAEGRKELDESLSDLTDGHGSGNGFGEWGLPVVGCESSHGRLEARFW